MWGASERTRMTQLVKGHLVPAHEPGIERAVAVQLRRREFAHIRIATVLTEIQTDARIGNGGKPVELSLECRGGVRKHIHLHATCSACCIQESRIVDTLQGSVSRRTS